MGTFIIGAIVLAAVVFAARKTYKDRKSGKACGGGCDGCCGCGYDLGNDRTGA